MSGNGRLAPEKIDSRIQLGRQHAAAEPRFFLETEGRLLPVVVPVSGRKPVTTTDQDVQLNRRCPENLTLKLLPAGGQEQMTTSGAKRRSPSRASMRATHSGSGSHAPATVISRLDLATLLRQVSCQRSITGSHCSTGSESVTFTKSPLAMATICRLNYDLLRHIHLLCFLSSKVLLGGEAWKR